MECDFDGCDRPAWCRGLCHTHYGQRQRGKELTPIRPRKKQRERGTGKIDEDGYLLLYKPDHPQARKGGYVKAHRMVMSDLLGRRLTDDETVHHKNGDRLDNRPENLELWSSRHPRGQRVYDLVLWANQIINKYGDDPEKWSSL